MWKIINVHDLPNIENLQNHGFIDTMKYTIEIAIISAVWVMVMELRYISDIL